MEIRKIKENEMMAALELVWNTFLEYEAPDYTEEGVIEFKKTIDDEKWIKDREFYGAFENNNIYGVIATKDKHHIALFFVDGKKHRLGIGRRLYKFIQKFNTDKYYTVNSSPYAKEVYKHLGFKELSEEKCVNGLRFIPMKVILD